jgi:hypothetical protein
VRPTLRSLIHFLIDEDNSPKVAEIGRLVTKNDDDFENMTKRFVLESLPHAGVLVIARSLDRRHTARIARTLVAYAALYPDGVPPYMLDCLHPATDG